MAVHVEFYLSEPAIYFGAHDLSENEEFKNLEPCVELQYGSIFDPSLSSIQQKIGMYFDWYDLPK